MKERKQERKKKKKKAKLAVSQSLLNRKIQFCALRDLDMRSQYSARSLVHTGVPHLIAPTVGSLQ